MTTKPKTEPTLPQSIEAFHRSLFSSGNAGSLATVSRGEYPRDCALAKELAKRYNAHDALVAAIRQLIYDMEGGCGHPVDWSDYRDVKNSMPAMHKILDDLGASIPRWKRRGPGWKRAALRAAGEKP